MCCLGTWPFMCGRGGCKCTFKQNGDIRGAKVLRCFTPLRYPFRYLFYFRMRRNSPPSNQQSSQRTSGCGIPDSRSSAPVLPSISVTSSPAQLSVSELSARFNSGLQFHIHRSHPPLLSVTTSPMDEEGSDDESESEFSVS